MNWTDVMYHHKFFNQTMLLNLKVWTHYPHQSLTSIQMRSWNKFLLPCRQERETKMVKSHLRGQTSAEQEFNLPADELVLSPMLSSESGQEGYQLPTRKRYPPRVLTYDELGTPTYDVRQLNGILQTPKQNLPYVSSQCLSTWFPPVQQYYYQFPFVYGVH